MSVTIMVDDTTDPRELAAIACLIAVLRGSDTIPAPPRVLFDYSDNPLGERPATPAALEPPAAEPAPTAAVAPDAPPPPPASAVPPPASEALLQQEANRATGATAADLDANGIPWDERIHAGTKVKNADNTWRIKRGADPALVTSVTAELKAASTTQPAAADAPPPPTEPAAVAAATASGADGAGNASEPVAPDAPPPPPANAAPAAPAAAADASTELTYPAIISKASAADMTYDALNELAVGVGLDKFQSLAKRPDLFQLFMGAMQAKIDEGSAAPAA